MPLKGENMKSDKNLTTITTSSKVSLNMDYLQSMLDSMQCAVDKAKTGSWAEDDWFLEKLNKAAQVMGYTLEKQ